MRHRNLILVISIATVLKTFCSGVLAQEVIPGSVLHLDALEQNRIDIAWKNLGLAGGAVPAAHANQIPHLRDGRIKDWTVQCLAKRNGPKWPGTVVAAQFAGFRSPERISK